MRSPTDIATASPPERRQHGRISRAETQLDALGDIGSPWRAESFLERLERHGDIRPSERLAGEDFARLFRLAHLDPLHAADMGQEVRSASRMVNRSEWARNQLIKALDALGGHTSPCGACAWHILGLELSMREWALRQSRNGRPINREVAKGILLGTLGTLAKHFY